MEAIYKEVIKAALIIFFTTLKAAGKSPEEMNALYNQERDEFLKKDPNDLPDV